MDRRGEKDAVNLASFMFPTKVKRSLVHTSDVRQRLVEISRFFHRSTTPATSL